MLESHIALNVGTERKREGEQHKAIKKEEREEDEVVCHKRYANPSRSLNKPCTPRNIVSG